MLFRQYFDPKLAQYAYLVGCQKSGEALLIDPERDIDRYINAARAEGLRIVAVAETHIHADFLSGAREFAECLGVQLYLSAEGGPDWQSAWAKTGAYNVTLLRDGDTFTVGHIEIVARHTPGHTPEHLSYVVIDRGSGATTPIGIATGDFVFVGDLGRPDLLEQAAGMHGVQEDAARTLYESLPTFQSWPAYAQIWPAHGAGSTCGKALGAVPQSTVGYEQLYNASLGAAASGEDAFVDAILSGQPEPQMYFARMKRDNRDGVPILGDMPQPRALSAGDLAQVVQAGEALVIDARLDRSAFMAQHIPGALYAPMNKSFNTVVGSLVVDETTPLVLILDEADVDEAVRDLIRIGYDRIEAFATPATLAAYFAEGGPSAAIPEIDFAEVEARRDDPNVTVVDVRFAAEFASAHVPDAVNASYTRLPEYAESRIPAGQTLLVHCASGGRAAAGAAYLAAQGHDVQYVNDRFAHYTEIAIPIAEGNAVAV
ncbi:MAG: rhodanese-like domain-containing protein [Bacteroidota bacterium]